MKIRNLDCGQNRNYKENRKNKSVHKRNNRLYYYLSDITTDLYEKWLKRQNKVSYDTETIAINRVTLLFAHLL